MLRTIKKWGNSYAIRLTAADLERHGWKPGQEIDFEIKPWRMPDLDFTKSPFVADGDPTAGARHDAILASRGP
jgi:hypothetical protein